MRLPSSCSSWLAWAEEWIGREHYGLQARHGLLVESGCRVRGQHARVPVGDHDPAVAPFE